MKKLLFAFLLLFPANAWAQGKIPGIFGTYAAGGCGLYAGLNTMGAATSVSGAAPGTVVAQGNVGAEIGYGCPIGTTAGNFWFAEGIFDWANLNGSSAGLSLTGPAHFEQRLGLGSPISTLLNLFPGFNGLSVPSLPSLPSGITYGPSYPYVFASVHEQDILAGVGGNSSAAWLVSPGLGLGLQSRLSNGVVADVYAEWVLASNGLSVGPSKVSLGNEALVGLQLKY